MPSKRLLKEITKCKHPNSRKTKALAKKAKRYNNREKSKIGHAIKSNILGEKFEWFTEQISDRQTPLTPAEFDSFILQYLKRFDEETQQIQLKQSISKNRAHQHASRLDIIKMTNEKETAEYNGGGLEFLNLCDPIKFKTFQEWDGNAVNLQHFKLDRIRRRDLIDISDQ